MRTLTLITLAVGAFLFLIGVFAGSGTIWIGFALLVAASALGLWTKWGPNGWGWELRRNRR